MFKQYVGVDISNLDFCASIFTAPKEAIITSTTIPNDVSGFEKLETWLIEQQVKANDSVICLEATGVYGEALSYYFTAKGFPVAVEPPLKVKRSFPDKGHKNDQVDSREIAEYAYRYSDELRIWHPKAQIIEQMQVLLMTREQLVNQRTVCKNTARVLNKKIVQTPLANKIYKQNIAHFDKQIQSIEKELKNLVNNHPDFRNHLQKLKTIPGIALLAVTNFMVITNGFENELAHNYRKASAFIGICPYQHQSGTSVRKKDRCARYGPQRLRKLLHLAARSAITHHPGFRKYYEQKKAQGKPVRLILNNVGNKLLKIMCAIIRTQRNYVENYVSFNPGLLLNIT
jgi:transposase